MSVNSPGWSSEVFTFIHKVGLREHPSLRSLRKETDRLSDGGMRSSVEQGQLLGFLVSLIGAHSVVEVGCFTGYGTLSMALALPPGGRITTLDVNDDWASIGRRYWREAGVDERIEFISGLAGDSLRALIDRRGEESADLVYVDADKKGYDDYYEQAMRLVRRGGVIALDNMLWGGSVADESDMSRQAVSLRTLNSKIHDDERVAPVMVPIGDGLVLARKI
jgi:predicted O-methyltransferase YrrM